MMKLLMQISTEIKILFTAMLTSMVLPIDNLLRFFIPIVSGIVWIFLKPIVESYRKKIADNKLKNNSEKK